MSKPIRYLVMDVDGTLTDGKIYMGANGELMKAFDIKDGYGIHDMLMPGGVEPVIITGRFSDILKNRCDELGITNLFQGVKDKVARLQSFLDEQNGEMSEVAYIGDDLNDLECIKIVRNEGGLTGSPFNAAREVSHAVNYKCKAKGGEGAVREFIEYILKKNDKIA